MRREGRRSTEKGKERDKTGGEKGREKRGKRKTTLRKLKGNKEETK